jgi:hypothetical protein
MYDAGVVVVNSEVAGLDPGLLGFQFPTSYGDNEASLF